MTRSKDRDMETKNGTTLNGTRETRERKKNEENAVREQRTNTRIVDLAHEKKSAFPQFHRVFPAES